MTIHTLLVDDEKEFEQLFQLHFRKEINEEMMKLSYANNVDDALDIIKNNSTDIILIFSDICMPIKDGFELLEKVKKGYPYITVFMITAYHSQEITNKATELGADLYLTKPINFKVLKEKINQFVYKSGENKEHP